MSDQRLLVLAFFFLFFSTPTIHPSDRNMQESTDDDQHEPTTQDGGDMIARGDVFGLDFPVLGSDRIDAHAVRIGVQDGNTFDQMTAPSGVFQMGRMLDRQLLKDGAELRFEVSFVGAVVGADGHVAAGGISVQERANGRTDNLGGRRNDDNSGRGAVLADPSRVYGPHRLNHAHEAFFAQTGVPQVESDGIAKFDDVRGPALEQRLGGGGGFYGGHFPVAGAEPDARGPDRDGRDAEEPE